MKEMDLNKQTSSEHNAVFWFHVLITVLAWVGPFLFSWYYLVPAYLIVLLQFLIFKRCLLNSSHQPPALKDSAFLGIEFYLRAALNHITDNKIKLAG